MESLVHPMKKGKESSFIFVLLLSMALLFSGNISTKIPTQPLPVFAIKTRTMHLVNWTLCSCCPLIGETQLTSAPPWTQIKGRLNLYDGAFRSQTAL